MTSSRPASTHSRGSSVASPRAPSIHTPHAPITPSRLWQSHAPGSSPSDASSPEEPRFMYHRGSSSQDYNQPRNGAGRAVSPTPSSGPVSPRSVESSPLAFESDGLHPSSKPKISVSDEIDDRGIIDEPQGRGGLTGQRQLLETYRQDPLAGRQRPRRLSRGSDTTYTYGAGGRYAGSVSAEAQEGGPAGFLAALRPRADTYGSVTSGSEFGDADGTGPGHLNKMSTTQWLAWTHGVKHTKRMYLSYYFPFCNWITQYSWSFFKGDLIAAITMASFYIPMALSYAANLGHLPPINGLYSFVFNPVIYALLGTCPQMVVGPEAAGSLLLGSVVKSSVDSGQIGDDDGEANAIVAGVVTGVAGAIILIAGIMRLGFLDSILSRPFLRGFISAIGFVILVAQLVEQLGLESVAKHVGGVSHESSITKLAFILTHLMDSHPLTCAVSITSFVVIMVCRTLKRRLQPRYPSVAYIPDRFLVVVLSAVLTYYLRWDEYGLEILGDVRAGTGALFEFRFPLLPKKMHHVKEAMETSFIIALLGFFESSVAAKSLGSGDKSSNTSSDRITGMRLSANRELIALGTANVLGGCFMALPAFGGYGRSKVNESTGGKTPMSSIFLSLITLLSVLFLLPAFRFLPKAVLASMISVVAYSLIEECPHDIRFFVRIRGYYELFLMATIFCATIFYSLNLGIALGMLFSILTIISHATQPRIQILGRIPGSEGDFEDAEDNPGEVEYVAGALIVKIPEPLTFANTGNLKSRLQRLEQYGTTHVHPSLPPVRSPEHNTNIIFDIHGVTSIDGSGMQVLTEIVDSYIDRGAKVYFCRIVRRRKLWATFEKSGIIGKVGGRDHFLRSVREALELADKEYVEGGGAVHEGHDVEGGR